MEWDSNYNVAFERTDDPRVLAVIQRDPEPFAPDGDAFAPAYFVDHGRAHAAGHTYTDSESDELVERYLDARDYWVNWHYDRTGKYAGKRLNVDRMLERWLRIFHDAAMVEVSSTIHRDDDVLIFDTPGWRAHVGAEPIGDRWLVHSVDEPGRGYVKAQYRGTREEAEAQHREAYPGKRVTRVEAITLLYGDEVEWSAYLDDEVYGIGYAVNESQVFPADDIDIEEWDVIIEGGGFADDDLAMREAHVEANHAAGELDPLLPLA